MESSSFETGEDNLFLRSLIREFTPPDAMQQGVIVVVFAKLKFSLQNCLSHMPDIYNNVNTGLCFYAKANWANFHSVFTHQLHTMSELFSTEIPVFVFVYSLKYIYQPHFIVSEKFIQFSYSQRSGPSNPR